MNKKIQSVYWPLRDEKPDFRNLAFHVLYYYIHVRGQSDKERIETLVSVANKIGFHVETMEKDGQWELKVPNKERGGLKKCDRK